MKVISEKTSRPSKIFVVGAVGVLDNEFNRLARIFGITNYRARSYKLVRVHVGEKHIAEREGFKKAHIDIYIVNIDDPVNVLEWGRYSNSKKNICEKSVVRLSSDKSHIEKGKYNITIPINPIRVLKALDNYTIKELNYFPEFEIGSGSSLQKSAMEGIQLLRSGKQTNTEGRQFRALIVDDSLAVRKHLEIEFNLLNAESVLAEDGERAIALADRSRFDIVFLDVVMPGLDGYFVCKKIKKSKFNSGTPVILLTSRSGSFDKLKGTLAGCDTYLTKPIDHNDFEIIANKYLKPQYQQ